MIVRRNVESLNLSPDRWGFVYFPPFRATEVVSAWRTSAVHARVLPEAGCRCSQLSDCGGGAGRCGTSVGCNLDRGVSADFSLARSSPAHRSCSERRARACCCAASTWCAKSGSSSNVQVGAGDAISRAHESPARRLPRANAGASRGLGVSSFGICLRLPSLSAVASTISIVRDRSSRQHASSLWRQELENGVVTLHAAYRHAHPHVTGATNC